MIRMPLTKTIKDLHACDLTDGSSVSRELFMNQRESTKLTVHASKESAIELFQKLPESVLPILPLGYQWVRSAEGKRSVIKTIDSETHHLEIVVYGPENNKINYLLLVNGAIWQSFAHTRDKKVFKRVNETYPMGSTDFTVFGFDYRGGAKSHIRGHCIDHADTMASCGRLPYSTHDSRNYIPEPHYKYWGCQMRRLLVADLRKDNYGYLQHIHYPENPLKTKNGTKVPSYLYFYPVTINMIEDNPEAKYTLQAAYNIDWHIDYQPLKLKAENVLSFSKKYMTDGAPIVKLWDAKQSDRAARLQLRNMYKHGQDIDKGSIHTINKGHDLLYSYMASAELEFESSKYRFSAACHASPENESSLARQELCHGLKYCDDLIEADIHEALIEPPQLHNMHALFHKQAPGFEDPHNQNQDHLKKMVNDLKDKKGSGLTDFTFNRLKPRAS